MIITLTGNFCTQNVFIIMWLKLSMTENMNLKNLFRKNKYVTEKVVYGNSTGKYSITRGCTVEISSKSEAKRKEIENQLKPLVKKYVENPQKLLQYLKFKGVKIYQINNAGKILSFFGEEEGFISKQTGIKSCILGIVLSIITEKKFNIAFSNSEILIFDSKSCDNYIIARAIHKYYSSKNNLPGYDKKSQIHKKK